jgi:hypothetical protein
MAVIEAIETVYMEEDCATVTFSSLGSYEHLQLRMSVRTDDTDNNDMVRINFNSDTGANYSRHYMRGYGSSTLGGADTAQTYSRGGWIPGATIDAAEYGTTIVDILDYRNASKNTTLSWLVGSAIDANVYFVSGMWDSTAAVTSIAMTPHQGTNFVRGTMFTLYGLNSS